jgi:hypothetical protein
VRIHARARDNSGARSILDQRARNDAAHAYEPMIGPYSMR